MADELIGITIGDYILRRQLGEGAFGSVFEGVHTRTRERRAIKIAGRNKMIGPNDTQPVWSTRALVDQTGLIARGNVDPSLVLRKQFEILKRTGPPLYPQVDEIWEFDGRVALPMELLEGSTLHDLLSRNAVPGDLPLELARALARLQKSGVTHGDLKPTNIVWSDGHVVLLDPGFFGELPLTGGLMRRVTITTPAYYPLREPDDMLAFGLILVQLAVGSNPLQGRGGAEPGLLGHDMQERIEHLHMANNYFFDGICGLSTRTTVGEKLAQSPFRAVIEQCLGVRLDSQVSEGPRYADFAAVEADLLQTRGTSPGSNGHRILRCFYCSEPVAGEERCRSCGETRTAPRCYRCGNAVSRARSQSVGLDRYAWNAHWDGRCASCGFEYAAKVKVATGHSTFFTGPSDPEFDPEPGGQSIIQIEAGESLHLACDFWDYQPVVKLHIKRAAALKGQDQLPLESSIVMTAEEWRTVIDKLQGELRPLLDRRAWHRDTT